MVEKRRGKVWTNVRARRTKRLLPAGKTTQDDVQQESVLTPVFNRRKPCRSRFLSFFFFFYTTVATQHIMCLSVVYCHFFYFPFFFSLLLGRVVHYTVPGTMRHGPATSTAASGSRRVQFY